MYKKKALTDNQMERVYTELKLIAVMLLIITLITLASNVITDKTSTNNELRLKYNNEILESAE